ncbi:hypothetical protein K502DRAFT_326192 [Neoconidiobolus thromboides FSU 785]|nr:hypothetical protein K502DRAFT_326192 [Neoconidiobolus thromboides FSU 785]
MPCKEIKARDMTDCIRCIVGKIGYRPVSKLDKHKLEVGFKNEEDRVLALNQKWEVNGYTIKTYRLWHHSDIVMRIMLSNLGNEFIGEELEEKLKAKFNIYGKVISCTHLFHFKEILYSDKALIFLMPNDATLNKRLRIQDHYLISRSLPLIECTYELAEIKCVHCEKTDHVSSYCSNAYGVEKLFEQSE